MNRTTVYLTSNGKVTAITGRLYAAPGTDAYLITEQQDASWPGPREHRSCAGARSQDGR
jgi:hypothetical protein